MKRTSIFISLVLVSLPLGLWWKSVHGQSHRTEVEKLTLHQVKPTSQALAEKQADEFLNQIWGAYDFGRGPTKVFLSLLDAVDARQAVTLLQRCEFLQDDDQRTELRNLLFGHLAELAPSEALALVNRGAYTTDLADKLCRSFVRAWKQQKPDTAAQWFQELKLKQPGNWEGLTDIFRISSSDGTKHQPVAAPSMQEGLKLLEDRLAASGSVSLSDREPLFLWAAKTGRWNDVMAQLENGTSDRRRFAMSVLWGNWANVDLHQAVNWVCENNGRTATSEALLDSNLFLQGANLTSKIKQDERPNARPEFMNEWIRLMDIGLSAQVGQENFREWTREEPMEASKWLKEQEGKSWRDGLVDVLAQGTIGYEPESSMTWALSIREEGLRDLSLFSCWAKWHGLDPAAADTWMNENVPDFVGIKERVARRHPP